MEGANDWRLEGSENGSDGISPSGTSGARTGNKEGAATSSFVKHEFATTD